MSVIFLFSGEARTSPFNLNTKKRNHDILKSYDKFLFTEEFKSLYKYKVYISTDDIHLSDTIKYFSEEHIGNIHLLNTEYYLKPIEQSISPVNFFVNKYDNINFDKCQKYSGSIYQHYKILDCYNLFRNDKQEKPRFIIRIRLDVIINKNLLDILKLFDTNTDLQICCGWDFIGIGKPDIMKCYCTGLENNYGNYIYKTILPSIIPCDYDELCIDKLRWTFAPERQLFEMLFEYCNNNNLDINKSIIHEKYGYCNIIR